MKAFEPPEWDLSKEYRDTIKQQNDYISAERQRCLKAVDDEPELPEGWKNAIQHYIDWYGTDKLIRYVVSRIKKNIRKRIEEGL